MEPTQLLELSYKGVTVVKALAKIQANNEIIQANSKILESLSDIQSTLQSIESIFHIQIFQPLKSGLLMLADAEAEYLVNKSSGQELAKSALNSFNLAEGQLRGTQNRLVALVGKACAYKLLDMRGAYNSTAKNANQIYSLLNDYEMKLREIISEQLEVDLREITPNASFQHDLGADCLDAVELIMAIEEEFNIEIPDEYAYSIVTLQDATRYLRSVL